MAIIEYEDGGVAEVSPNEVAFKDTKKFIYRAEREATNWDA